MAILVCRAAHALARTAAFFAAQGYPTQALALATTQPQPLPHSQVVAEVIVLTSAAAVTSLAAATRSYRLLACVGEATAQAAREAGLEPDLVGPAQGEAMARLILHATAAWAPGWRLVHVTGDRPHTAWYAAFAAAGVQVTTLTAYTTVYRTSLPEPQARGLQTGEIAAVLLFSAQSAQTFVKLYQALAPCQAPPPALVCLSPAVAAACQNWPAPAHVAPLPDRHGMAACLRRLGLQPGV